MKRSVVLVAAVAILAVGVVPVSAGEAPAVRPEPDLIVIHDFQNDLAVFWNVTKEAWCEWQAEANPGPLPELMKNLEFTYVQETEVGFRTSSFNEASHIELWRLHGADFEAVCGMDGNPWADGEVTAALKTVGDPETVDPTLVKINGQGTVTETATGDPWHYSWISLNQSDTQEFNLRRKGS